MVAVPGVTPVTTPAVTVAWALLLLQVPPATPSVIVIVASAHTPVAPVIVPASGMGLIAISFVAVAVPQLLVTE